MIKSMTGFGKAICESQNFKVTAEIKSVNGKQSDVKIRMPSVYGEKEMQLRSLIAQSLERGNIELSLFIENSAENPNYSFNKPLALKYYSELKSLSKEINQENKTDYIGLIMKMPDVLKPEKSIMDEKEWDFIYKTVVKVLEEVDKSRRSEGIKLERDFRKRIDLIFKLLKETEKLDLVRLKSIKQRLQNNLLDVIDKNKIDENRLEQELVFYVEKIDITEEKVRLKSHCNYFLETLADKNSQGKKLGFISQEMGREINTLGSKANNVDIQKKVVIMKDELEKIKEQLMNVL
ncbi:MAG: YicC family protein [Bacteroidales bacterium]|nr:YicC family protein [Bacteroidales bacterium]